MSNVCLFFSRETEEPRGRGVARTTNRTGRPQGSKRPEGNKSHLRALGEAVLRRDPTAFEKLA
eukprot:14258495-Heterocapsa_arctica.AAC.1